MHDKRIALLCQHFYPEMISTGLHMTELALGLNRLGWRIHVYSAQPSLILDAANPEVPGSMEYEGIRISRVRTLGQYGTNPVSRALFGVSYTLASTMRVIASRSSISGLLITTNPPFLALVGVIGKLLLGLPYVLIVYDVYPDIAVRLGVLRPNSAAAWLWERATRLMLRHAASIVVIGRDMDDRIRAKLDPRQHAKTRLVFNWSDESTVAPVPRESNAFRAEQQITEHQFVVQYSGRMALTHNLEPLIEAAERLRDKPVVFQFIGDGAKKSALQQLVSDRALTNVRFLPYQPLQRLRETLSAADLSVVCLEAAYTGLSVPSKTYGIMASGTPILGFVDPASEIGRTILENDCGAVLADPTGANIAGLIEKLLAQPEELKRWASNGYAAFKAHYTLSRAASLYDEILSEAFVAGTRGD
jgi:glycosyltransferase involved in cell wall biosynthesis